MTEVFEEGLVLERRSTPDKSPVAESPSGASVVMFTPPISEDYWAYRVVVANGQAVVGFGKFGTVGIGFAHEPASWNTNLPYSSSAERILDHIWSNRGEEMKKFGKRHGQRVARLRIQRAIEMIQAAIEEDGAR